ncbi:aminodeoxychorismate lyase [Rhodomicrobium udaipurense JA643]|uniref:Endolytic murein transglycosylase n=1 Tax=Rhodomicrobium udaipurense TaxID=1202716 RepID=A0A8I1GEV1_9HYPH|nr:endolytic transglycosylase MltG [Rhodomicrobium udaipurense]KAI95407.1 aminodeoxychorismate lyase [Rhodomicrobium udaipurense JA643]MBJ7543509.1 endolytic transglycosylase MltG [Rhodomicrobium udaipurense]
MPSDYYNANGNSRYSKNAAYRGQRDYSVLPRSPSEALEPERAPEPPEGSRGRRQNPIVVFLNRLLTFFLVLLIAVGTTSYVVRLQFDKPGPLAYPTVFVVPRGEGVSAIARRLEQEGIINDRWTFFIAARYFKVHDKIKAGEYNIKAEASLRDVLDTLVEGKSILYSVSVPEGLTSWQVIERLKANPDLVGDILEIPPEGSLLPDTYRFARGTSRDELIRRMQGEQKKFIEGLWATRSRDLALTTPEQVINLAAIVEKEASRADERPRVAAVYLNRLKKRMRLEADPTIIYGASGGKGTLGRPILKSEVEDETNPYNTYRNAGLPPTPIANPGRAAIEAVLKPAKSGDLFFVADGTGAHVFAETYSDHQKNVARWRAIERSQREEKAADPAADAVALDKLQAVDIPLPQRNPHR